MLPYGSFSQYQDPQISTSGTAVIQHHVETLGIDIGAIVEKRVSAHLDQSLHCIVEQHFITSGARKLYAQHVESFQYPETPYPLVTQLCRHQMLLSNWQSKLPSQHTSSHAITLLYLWLCQLVGARQSCLLCLPLPNKGQVQ